MLDLKTIVRELEPELRDLEKERQRLNIKFVTFSVLATIALAIAIGVALSTFQELVIVVFIGSLFVIGATYHFTVAKSKGRYATRFKNVICERLCKAIDPNLSFRAIGGISRTNFNATELFARPDRYHSEDLITGKLGQTEVRLAEVKAEERRGGDNQNGYRTIFEGLVLIADFHKHFNGRTFLFPDTAERALGNIGRTFQAFGGRRGTRLIQLENVTFEKAFAVYASDEVEARYILSPALMERIVDCRRRFKRDLHLAFKDSLLVVAIPYRSNYLEPKTSVPANDETQIDRLRHQMTVFLDIVHELDLNTRIWTKD